MDRLAAIVPGAGELSGARFASVPREPPGDDEVEIEVEAAALNFKDVLLALGVLPADARGVRLGFECAGRVRARGAEVTRLAVGERVVALGTGCLASSVCVPAATVCRQPAMLDSAAATTLPVAFVTASYALEELARVRAGDSVLIHAATGGVGLAAVQIARRAGATIFATAGSDAKRAYLRELGIAHVLDSRTPAFAGELLRATGGRGVDVVLNSLSGELLAPSLAVLAPHGRFVELGARDAIEGRSLALSVFARGASFCAVGYQGAIPRLAARLAEVVARVEAGELAPLPREVFPAPDLAGALSHLARAKHIGKVVVAFEDAARLSRDEGIAIFELALAAQHSHLIVSKTPLHARLHAPHGPRELRARPADEPPAEPAVPPRHPRPPLAALAVAPRGHAEAAIVEVLGEALRIAPVGVHDDFFALGGDSLLAVQIAHALSRELGTDVPSHLLLEHPTAARLAERLGSRTPAAGSRHLVRLAEGPAGARPIFVVHPIGGHVYFYRPLALALAPVCPVIGIQALGIDGEAPPLETVEGMADHYIRAIREVASRGPYRLAGSSFGGVVAFAMARALTAAGDRVELLALVDSPGPGLLPAGFASDAEILAYLLAKGIPDPAQLARLRGLSAEDQLHEFVRCGGAADRLSPGATVDAVRHFLALYRANYEALRAYRAPAYDGAAVFFRATEPDGVNPPSLERAWRARVRALEVVTVGGNHTTMNLPPHVTRIAEHLAVLLSTAPETP